jgi:hypothetical protein
MSLRITDHGDDRTMTLAQLQAVIGGGGGGGGSPARTTVHATYYTKTVSPTVYYTALASDGVSILTTRRTSGVTLVGGLYTFVQDVTDVTDFIAVWDEGDVNDFIPEWIVVDT